MTRNTKAKGQKSAIRSSAAKAAAAGRRAVANRAPTPWKGQAACIDVVAGRLAAHESLSVVTGAQGSGKTTTAQRIARLARHGEYLHGARLDRASLLTVLARSLAAPLANDTDESLEPLILKMTRKGRPAKRARPIVIDDADQMPADSLALVLYLATLQPATEARLGFVLVGSPDLTRMLRTFCASVAVPQYSVTQLSPLRLNETRALARQLLSAPRRKSPAVSSAFVLALHLVSGGRPERVRELIDRCRSARTASQPSAISGPLGIGDLLRGASIRPGSASWNRLVQALHRLAHLPAQLRDRLLGARGLGWASAAAGLALGVMIGHYAPDVLVHEVRAAATPTAISMNVAASQTAHSAPLEPAEPAAAPIPFATLPWAAPLTYAELPAPVLESMRHPLEVSFDNEAVPTTRAVGSARPVHSVTLVARLADPVAVRSQNDAGGGLVDIRLPRPSVATATAAAATTVTSRPTRLRAPNVPTPDVTPFEAASIGIRTQTDSATRIAEPMAPRPMPDRQSSQQVSDPKATQPVSDQPPVLVAQASDAWASPRTTLAAAPAAAASTAVTEDSSTRARSARSDTRLEKRARSGTDDLVRAGEAIALGRNTEALQLLRKALAENPSNHDARSSLLAVLGERGKDDEWLEALSQAAAVSPEHFGIAAVSGHLESNRLEEARTLLERMPERLRDARLYGLAGVLYTKLQRHGDALNAYDQALAATAADAPRRRSLQLARAVILEHLGRFDEARTVYRAAIDNDAPASAAAFARSRLAQLDLNR